MYGNEYTIEEVFDGLTDAIFKADLRGEVNSIRRNLQTEYVNRLIDIAGAGKGKTSKYDYISQATAFFHLKKTNKMVSKGLGKDEGTKHHREFLHHKINLALETH